jgi:hypothetical protein
VKDRQSDGRIIQIWHHILVMAGLDPAIHVPLPHRENVDTRLKPGMTENLHSTG